MQDILFSSLALLAVAFLWGATNPYIRKASSGVAEIQGGNVFTTQLKQFFYLATKWQYILPFGINQSGTFFYLSVLGNTQISLAVPLTNSLTLLFTLVSGLWTGEKYENLAQTFLGLFFVAFGVALCILSKTSFFE